MNEYDKVSADEVESLNELAKLDGASVPTLASEEYVKKVNGFDCEFGVDSKLGDENDLSEENNKAAEAKETEDNKEPENGNTTEDEKTDSQTEDEKKQETSSLDKTAEVFGVSKEKMEEDFKHYKANILFSKVAIDLTNVDLSYKEMLRRLTDADAYNLDSATVLPDFVATVLKANLKIKLNIAVGYPYGVETLAVKKYMIKRAARRNVDGIVVYVSAGTYKEMKKRILVKELKALKRCARKKNFIIAFDISKLTNEELQTFSNALIQAEITKVMPLSNTKSGLPDEYALVRLCDMGKDKFEVIASTAIGEAEKAINLFETGIVKFSCENAVELAKSFKAKLGV